MQRTLRIALYSHDTMGLGHMRRNLLLAGELASSPLRPSVLLLSGSREITRFTAPQGVDVLTLPALYKDSASQYHARSLSVPLRDIVALRSAAILGALEAYSPDVFVVDNVPRGAVGELEPALLALRRQHHTRCVLGLRDILDEAAHVRSEWARAANVQAIRRFYDAIWVYGDPKVADLAAEYGFPADVAGRMQYTGYLDQRVRMAPPAGDSQAVVDASSVLCLLGGGQDGIGLAESFARVQWPSGYRGVLVHGPMMSANNRLRLQALAGDNDRLQLMEFLDDPATSMRLAHGVVTMGGYNTVCDVLSHDVRALVVPRVHPRTEQLIRAQRLAARGLLDMLHPDDATPDAIAAWAVGRTRPIPLAPVRLHTPETLHTMLDDVMALPQRSRRSQTPARQVLNAS